MINSVGSGNINCVKNSRVAKRPSFGAVIPTFVCRRPDNVILHYPVAFKMPAVLKNLVAMINKNGNERIELLDFLKKVLLDLKVDKPIARSTHVDGQSAKPFGMKLRLLLTGEQADFIKGQSGSCLSCGYDDSVKKMLSSPKHRVFKDEEELALLILTSGDKYAIDGIQLRPLKQFLGDQRNFDFQHLINREPVIAEVYAPAAPPTFISKEPPVADFSSIPKAAKTVVQYAQCLLL